VNEPHAEFQTGLSEPELSRMAALDAAGFREMFGATPVMRAKHRGFLRNVAIAMGNAAKPEFREQLQILAGNEDTTVAEAAGWALGRIGL
jgi:epoxyqueuosine reductase